MACITGCQSAMDRLTQSAGAGNSSSPGLSGQDMLSLFDREDAETYDPQTLPNICASFKDVKRCYGDCPPNPMLEIINKAFAPLDFICLEKYDGGCDVSVFYGVGRSEFLFIISLSDFVKYGECTAKASKSSKSRCEQQCGNEKDIAKEMLTSVNVSKDGSARPDMAALKGSFTKICK